MERVTKKHLNRRLTIRISPNDDAPSMGEVSQVDRGSFWFEDELYDDQPNRLTREWWEVIEVHPE